MNANDVIALGLQPSRWKTGVRVMVLLMLVASAVVWIVHTQFGPHNVDDAVLVRAEKRIFKRVLSRPGAIQPVKEERIYCKLAGTIEEILPEGALAHEGEVVMRLDAIPHEDAKADQMDLMATAEADFKELREKSRKLLNVAREDVKTYQLRLELEQLRLAELKKGPTPQDEMTAKVNLENNQNLYKAKVETAEATAALAKLGYAASAEQRQTELEASEQNLKVAEMDIAHRKLNLIDPVLVGTQELKVKEALKTRNTAMERVDILERTIARDEERYKLKRERSEERLKELEANLAKTVYKAPCTGVVVPRKNSWGMRFAPGREVYDGMEVVTIPDLSKMKCRLSIDEGHISRIAVGMPASVLPAGWSGAPLQGTVTKISEQGRDEFEQFQDDTTAISGTANRKVFDVEVELSSHSKHLRLGLRCDVEIVIEQLENAIVIPRAALQKQKDGDVMVSVCSLPSGAIERRKIKVNAESDLWAAVSGVKEGERLSIQESKTN